MRITGRQLRRIIQEEVSRMMNEAPDIERKKIDLLSALADGRVVTDANATDDERLTINAMLDAYINKSGNEKLKSLAATTLPTSPFANKLRAVQADLGMAVDGRFGKNSMMGIVRAGSDMSSEIEDILDMLGTQGQSPASPTTDELGALIKQGRQGQKNPLDLGPGIVQGKGTGSTTVDVGPGPKVGLPATAPVFKAAMLRMFTTAQLNAVRRKAIEMQESGGDPVPYIRSQLGNSPEAGRVQADALLAALGITPR